jgi:poly-gamma-glutamate synthesis protein (capsule biosynthesis protein)
MAGSPENRGTASYTIYPDDLQQIERSVRNGKEQSDFMVVGIHAHESRGNVRGQVEMPPDFLIEYARRSIDNGADLFAGTGPWSLRGIEIYKGRPIFYGLSLMVGSSNNTPIGYDRYRDHGLDPFNTEFTDVEMNWTSWFGPNIINETNRSNIGGSESAVAEAVFQDGKLVEVIVTPMELFYNRPMSQMGIPRIATGEVAQRILTRLQQLSKPLGTNVSIKGDKGYIRIGPDGGSQ